MLELQKEYLLKTPSRDKWQKIGLRKRSGILVPLFSVYSKDSTGIGDFSDLKLLIDFAHSSANSIVQLLPMNEMGSFFCPYDSISSFALEPVYINLEQISVSCKRNFKIKIEDLRKRFPVGKPYVDYAIKEEKMQLLREMFYEEDICNLPDFRRFREENSYWLEDFALFKVLKSYHADKPWYEWEDRYKNRDSNQLEIFSREHTKDINFQIWLQWQLFKQFRDVSVYAKAKRVLLKGDLPVLVSRDSADVWAHPEFFKLEFASGAPPDMYCAKGQRWGMPPYNWNNIFADNARYIKEKLKFAENFYDILRIDHVVGLFRIWSIPYNEPLENQGLNGFFDPQDESRWGEQGANILRLFLNNTDMLLCAEDLGVIPKVCTDTLKELGIPGNDVQRWVKDWKVKHDFLVPQEYRFLSVAMLSTHDTTNWPAWWEHEAGTIDEALFIRKCNDRGIDYTSIKDRLFDLESSRHGRLRWLNSITSSDLLVSILGKARQEVEDFIELYENTYQEKEKLWRHLNIRGPMRENSDSEIVRAALKITLESNAIFCINTLIDWLYLDDVLKGDIYQYRINTPGTISKKNWSLTLPISLDELLRHRICGKIRELVSDSRRI